MAVDRRLIKPFLKEDDLVVETRRKLADVLKVVTAKGYVESDGYGTHEGGYVVVEEGDDPNQDAPYGDQQGWGVPRRAYASTFSAYLPFSNHDRLRQYPKKYDVDDWLLDKPTPRPPPKKEAGEAQRPQSAAATSAATEGRGRGGGRGPGRR